MLAGPFTAVPSSLALPQYHFAGSRLGAGPYVDRPFLTHSALDDVRKFSVSNGVEKHMVRTPLSSSANRCCTEPTMFPNFELSEGCQEYR